VPAIGQHRETDPAWTARKKNAVKAAKYRSNTSFQGES
jgi:hypothetical protein